MSKGKVIFLGTGTSIGVPMIGCTCQVCQSSDPRDVRLRCSVLIEIQGKHLLIDCGPDFRRQAIEHQILRVDAVLITHEHYDHVGGLDDLRPLGSMQIYAEKRVNNSIVRVMPYCFGTNKYPGSPTITLNDVRTNELFEIAGLQIMPLRVIHGRLPITGYRIGDFAYITDASSLPEETTAALIGVKTLVINALQIPVHPSHFSLEEAITAAQKIGAEQVYFTHFSHKIGLHAQTDAQLPKNMHLAYDGLEIEL